MAIKIIIVQNAFLYILLLGLRSMTKIRTTYNSFKTQKPNNQPEKNTHRHTKERERKRQK